MTTYQNTTLATLADTFGNSTFTLFEAGDAMGTTAGNIRFTINRLVKCGAVVCLQGAEYCVARNNTPPETLKAIVDAIQNARNVTLYKGESK